ncbi:MAG: hypothetical protein HS116_06995 [Planctomycetes bacterium]|nr:hypothetical protein [Planctomycetota bacterium]
MLTWNQVFNDLNLCPRAAHYLNQVESSLFTRIDIVDTVARVATSECLRPWTQKDGFSEDDVTCYGTLTALATYWQMNLKEKRTPSLQLAYIYSHPIWWKISFLQRFIHAGSVARIPESKKLMTYLLENGVAYSALPFSASFHFDHEFWGDPSDYFNAVEVPALELEGRFFIALVFWRSRNESFVSKVVEALSQDPHPDVRMKIHDGLKRFKERTGRKLD